MVDEVDGGVDNNGDGIEGYASDKRKLLHISLLLAMKGKIKRKKRKYSPIPRFSLEQFDQGLVFNTPDDSYPQISCHCPGQIMMMALWLMVLWLMMVLLLLIWLLM